MSQTLPPSPPYHSPTVSVIMCIYNGEAFLAESLDSILNQSYTDFEVILLDDASTDNTPNILKRYAEQDKRVRLFRNEQNMGLTRSLNKAASFATGTYFARQDADDWSYPTRLAKQVRFLESNPDISLLTGWFDVVNEQGDLQFVVMRSGTPLQIRWYMLFGNFIGGHSLTIFPRWAFEKVGGYDEHLRYTQDYGLWLKLQDVGRVAILPQRLMKWRLHESNITNQNTDAQRQTSAKLSQDALFNQTGLRFSFEDMSRLRDFFFFHNVPIDLTKLDLIESQIRQVYDAFSQHHDASDIKTVVASRYICRMMYSPKRKAFAPKMMRLALKWHPQTALITFLNEVKDRLAYRVKSRLNRAKR